MPDHIRTELAIPAAASLQPLVKSYGSSLAVLAGLPADQAHLLVQALWEACQNSIDAACDAEGEAGLITLVGELTPKALILSIHDRGLPFDQNLDPESMPPAPATLSRLPRRCPGLTLIHRAADEVTWINHGLNGKELRLTKYCRTWCPSIPPADLPCRPPQAEAPLIQPQEYTIRPVRPADAIRVAQLMYRVYGYTYPRVDVYYPERLAHNIAAGSHVGVVAEAADGEIVGHVAVIRPDLGPLAEAAMLAVAPRHRGQGLKKRLSERLNQEIQGLGLLGLYAEAVTSHTISQEAAEAHGLKVAGLELLHAQVYIKELGRIQHQLGYQDTTSGAGFKGETALVFYFQHLTPPETARIYAPPRHRHVLARIYQNLGTPVEFKEPGPVAAPGRLAVTCNRQIGAGFIKVNRIGTDTGPEIVQACRDLSALAGVAAVFLDVPLAQAGAPDLCDAAHTAGFFFSGLRPRFAADGDFLRLQYLNAPLDPEHLHLASPFARELLHYILQDRARTAPHRAT